jgi:hypothetical protein
MAETTSTKDSETHLICNEAYGPFWACGLFICLTLCQIPQSLTESTMIEENDSLIIRCPQLGGEVPFRYCRTTNEDFPCRKIIICWEFRLEIGKFLSEHYTVDEIQRALAPPSKSRLETIIELVEKAKKIKDEGG